MLSVNIIENILSVSCFSELQLFLKALCKILALENSIYVFIPKKANFDFFMIDNYPGGYVEEYKAKNRILVDPVINYAKSNSNYPFYWDEFFNIENITDEEQAALEYAKDQYQITFGLSSYFSSDLSNKSVLHFTLNDTDRLNREKLETVRLELFYIAPLIHYKVQDLFLQEMFTKNIKLTTRETEALILAAQGYTIKESAKKMGISPPTVSEYLTNASIVLGSKTKTESIAKALIYKQIHPLDVMSS